MANSFFQFKQFKVEQGQCGMKVTTDACLFGAIASKKVIDGATPNRILDIGTGTGLLSLMLAQATHVTKIHAIEIDQGTYHQARVNFRDSPWTNILSIELSPFQEFNSDNKFDLIISNPPFFSKNQLGDSSKKNLAIHNETLTVNQLANGVNEHLNEVGLFYLFYPPYEMGLFIQAARAFGLFPNEIIAIKDRITKPIIRQAVIFSRTESVIHETELVIKEEDGTYTDIFIDLLKPYYLHL